MKCFVAALRCAVLGLLLPTLAWSQARFDQQSTATLLPRGVRPVHIALQLDVDPARDAFTGEIGIEIRVDAEQRAIVLHAEQLDAHTARLDGRALTVRADAERSTWTLQPEDGARIAPGTHRLQIAYQGRVQTSGEGLYRADHSVAGEPARMLATQLEAISARRVFPGFDEPVFRSSVDLTVRAPAGLQVLANMPLAAKRPLDGGRLEHRFQTTPRMPGYLLAFAVGRFDVLQGKSGRLPLGIYTVPGKREQGRYALAATRELLPYFERYFGQAFALPKLDQLGVPGTRQGAMEDWGLISYREDLLLVDARTPPSGKQRVYEVVAHELAHQWFGNLVSTASWNEIWLNEAFATWMEKKATERFHPEWQIRLQQRRGLDETMDRDAGPATRAIRSGPVVEAAVSSVFDGITYRKGGAVLSMIEQWLGERRFEQGLRAYMAERRLQPATAGDLWFHMGQAARKPVAEMASRWTDQPGMPRIGVDARCDQGRTRVLLSQSRFSLGDPLPDALWPVPVRLAHGKELRTVLVDGPTAELILPGCDARPIVANAGGLGYYRVDYAPALRERLQAGFASLAPIDRSALLSDSFAFARAGQRGMAEHFALLAALPAVQGAGRAPLYRQALDQFDWLDAAFDGTPAQQGVRNAARALFAPELARLGWQPGTGESTEVQSLRGRLVAALGQWGDDGVVAEARRRFDDALAARGPPPARRGGVGGARGAPGRPQGLVGIVHARDAADGEEERRLLIRALAAVRDEPQLQRLLDATLTTRWPGDLAVRLLGTLGDEAALSTRVYDYVAAHWPALAERAGDGVFGGRLMLLPMAAKGASDARLAARLLDEQRRRVGTAGMPAAERTAGAILMRARVRERESESLGTALAHWAPGTTVTR